MHTRLIWEWHCAYSPCAEWNCAHSPSVQNGIMHSHQVCGMTICVLTKYSDWHCAYSLYMCRITLCVFATVPDSRINSWQSWFIFNLWKINTNQYYESDSLNAGKQHDMWMHDITRQQIHNNYCTYLNSGLLEAPCEYVLHGLVPGLNWAPFWPLPMSMHLVATPSPVSCCLLQQFKFLT
jgi:hypothetical protein